MNLIFLHVYGYDQFVFNLILGISTGKRALWIPVNLLIICNCNSLKTNVCFTADAVEALGYCSFPDFLWTSPQSDTVNSSRQWLSHTVYMDNTADWRKQKQITVHETEIEVVHHTYSLCPAEGGRTTRCYKRTLRQTIICIQHELDGKIRVQQMFQHRG